MLLELLDTDQAKDHQGYSQEEEWDPTDLHKDLGQSHDDGRQDHYSRGCRRRERCPAGSAGRRDPRYQTAPLSPIEIVSPLNSILILITIYFP
jgi:hypothetical protein